VELAGSGLIVGSGVVETLFIANSSHIQASSMTIATYLELFDNSELSATSNGTITLGESVALRFSARTEVTALPKLDLGIIGDSYDTLPAELVVSLGEVKIENTVLDTLKVPLVQGRTLANCDKWVVNFEGEDASKLGTKCEDGELPAGARMLLDDDLPLLRTLYVVKAESGKPTKDPGPNVGLIVGIVIAVVVVIAIVIGVVIFLKKGSGGGGGSASSGSVDA
jgi:hypothetical protein